MQEYSRLVGIDVGKKRVGIAQTDLLKTFATPVGTYAPTEAIEKLKDIAKNAPIDKFVVGWPLTMKGDEGPATQMVDKFIKKLRLSFPDMEIVKNDERLTSQKAKEIMIKSGVPRKKRREKKRVDRIAAAIILQDYLDNN